MDSNNSGNNYTVVYREAAYKTRPVQGRTKKRNMSVVIISLCLACLLLGTGIGVGSFYIWNAMGNASIYENLFPEIGDIRVPATERIDIPAEFPAIRQPIYRAEYTGQTMSATDIYAMAINSCVGVTIPVPTTNFFGQQMTQTISGSGFIVSSDGYIVTNYHVIEAAHLQNLDINIMLYDGREYPAKIAAVESDGTDFALLKIDAEGLAPVVLGSMESTRVGDDIYAIGNPLGMLTWTMTEGIVSAFDREIAEGISMFQISAAINSGNSGGPVFNDKGEVIGIATAKYTQTGVEGLGFAIPIDDVRSMIDEVLSHGYIRGRPYFGITVRTASQFSGDALPGAVITAVDSSSCAGVAGLIAGDIITKVDEHGVTGTTDLRNVKKLYKPGDTVIVTVYREGETLELQLTFDEEGAPRT